MEPLLYAFDRVAPQLQTWVAMFGKVPAGTLTIAALIALWFARRLIAPFVLVLPGLVAGVALGWWLTFGLGWHPLLAIVAGLVLSAGVFQILGHVFFVRLGLAVILAPIAILAVWHLAAGALDMRWALAITAIGAGSVASLLRRFVQTENHELYAWASDLIADLRGD
jgi:hypothetical protein